MKRKWLIISVILIFSSGCLSTTTFLDEMGHNNNQMCGGDMSGGLMSIMGDFAIGYALKYDKDNKTSDNFKKGVTAGLGITAVDLLVLYFIFINHQTPDNGRKINE